MSKKVAILDVPEPTNIRFEYVYDSYVSDESFVADQERRRFVLTGRLPQLNTVSFGLTTKTFNRDQVENKMQTSIEANSLEGQLNLEESLRIEDTFVLSNDIHEIKRDALNLLSSWAAESGLRGDPIALFAEETGLTFAGFEDEEFREGFLAAELPARFSGSATNGLLNEIQEYALKDEPLDEETFWRISAAAPPQTPLFVSRIGLWIESNRRPLWKNAEIEKLPPQIFFLGNNPEFSLNINALHGYEYKFAVRSLYLLTLLNINQKGEIEEKQRYYSFCASRPRFNTLDSFVYERPQPPQDLQTTWDYDQNALRLRWNLPQDPKKVIKRIQLFKKTEVDQPYKLLREWDWNDNQVLWPREGREEIPRTVQKREKPLGWWYDTNFKPKPGNIAHYALTTTTTHGISSTYSIQISTRWLNAQKGVINSLLSRSGAPKAYPNLLLENLTARREGITTDVLSVEGIGKFQVLFDPECTIIENESGEKIRDYRQKKWLISTLQHETLKSNWTLLKTEDEKLILGKKPKTNKRTN